MKAVLSVLEPIPIGLCLGETPEVLWAGSDVGRALEIRDCFFDAAREKAAPKPCLTVKWSEGPQRSFSVLSPGQIAICKPANVRLKNRDISSIDENGEENDGASHHRDPYWPGYEF